MVLSHALMLESSVSTISSTSKDTIRLPLVSVWVLLSMVSSQPHQLTTLSRFGIPHNLLTKNLNLSPPRILAAYKHILFEGEGTHLFFQMFKISFKILIFYRVNYSAEAFMKTLLGCLDAETQRVRYLFGTQRRTRTSWAHSVDELMRRINQT